MDLTFRVWGDGGALWRESLAPSRRLLHTDRRRENIVSTAHLGFCPVSGAMNLSQICQRFAW